MPAPSRPLRPRRPAVRRPGVWWVVASACSYSLFTVFSKWALRDLRPTDVLAWRFAIAAPVGWAVVAVRRRRGGAGLASAPARGFLAAGAVFGVVALLAFGALDHLSAALYIVIIYTYPAMVAAGSALAGRRPPRHVWVAIGVSLLGVACTVPQVFDQPDADGLGLVLTLGNAAAYAVYVLGSGRLHDAGAADPRGPAGARARPDGVVASAYSFTGSLVFALLLVPFLGWRAPHDLRGWIGLVGLAVVSTVVAGATLLVGMRHLPPATAALVATMEPVLTLVWAVLILGESLVVLQVVGALLVIGGVVWSQRTATVVAAEPG